MDWACKIPCTRPINTINYVMSRVYCSLVRMGYRVLRHSREDGRLGEDRLREDRVGEGRLVKDRVEEREEFVDTPLYGVNVGVREERLEVESEVIKVQEEEVEISCLEGREVREWVRELVTELLEGEGWNKRRKRGREEGGEEEVERKVPRSEEGWESPVYKAEEVMSP